jgi:hypothetical protein
VKTAQGPRLRPLSLESQSVALVCLPTETELLPYLHLQTTLTALQTIKSSNFAKKYTVNITSKNSCRYANKWQPVTSSEPAKYLNTQRIHVTTRRSIWCQGLQKTASSVQWPRLTIHADCVTWHCVTCVAIASVDIRAMWHSRISMATQYFGTGRYVTPRALRLRCAVHSRYQNIRHNGARIIEIGSGSVSRAAPNGRSVHPLHLPPPPAAGTRLGHGRTELEATDRAPRGRCADTHQVTGVTGSFTAGQAN